MLIKKQYSGFTIVELLIVIVVIGILAAITIVAFNGIQSRANFAAYKSDIDTLNKAVNLYYADNGAYPGNLVGTNGCWTNTGTRNFISGLTPTYLPELPLTPNASAGNYYAYCFRAGGTEYKLIRLVNGGMTLPTVESTNNPDIDPIRSDRGWGVWSSDGSAL